MKRCASLVVLLAACDGEKRDSFTETTSPTEAPDASIGRGALPRAEASTCADAEARGSYVGCEYWPTVTANAVWSDFDFAVAVANVGAVAADIHVTGPNAVDVTEHIPPGELRKIRLPWVRELKGPDWDVCTKAKGLDGTVVARHSAYHLVSTRPVVVYQFNALEYQGTWPTCPGSTQKCRANAADPGMSPGCFSFSNDASLLVPTSAMRGVYRITGQHGWSELFVGPILGSYVAVTATHDATHVSMKLSANARVRAGGGIAAAKGGETISFALDAGDVAEISAEPGADVDLSGSLVSADQRVQVLSGIGCIDHPEGAGACDHLEESVLPAETLGHHYVVAPPTSPRGAVVGHIVRMFGNVDGTSLAYAPSRPPGCPATLDAGQVADCGIVASAFEVTATHEIGIGSFMLGGSAVDPPPTNDDGTYKSLGDPSHTQVVPVEQWRTDYVFLAPDDYEESWVDVASSPSASVLLDGQPVASKASPAGAFVVRRIALLHGSTHTIRASERVGIQVMGYGAYTSYAYPGGLDLLPIAPAPPH